MKLKQLRAVSVRCAIVVAGTWFLSHSTQLQAQIDECRIERSSSIGTRRVSVVGTFGSAEQLFKVISDEKVLGLSYDDPFDDGFPETGPVELRLRDVPYWDAVASIARETELQIMSQWPMEFPKLGDDWKYGKPLEHWATVGPVLILVVVRDPIVTDPVDVKCFLHMVGIRDEANARYMCLTDLVAKTSSGKAIPILLEGRERTDWTISLPKPDTGKYGSIEGKIWGNVALEFVNAYVRPGESCEDLDLGLRCTASDIHKKHHRNDDRVGAIIAEDVYSCVVDLRWPCGLNKEQIEGLTERLACDRLDKATRLRINADYAEHEIIEFSSWELASSGDQEPTSAVEHTVSHMPGHIRLVVSSESRAALDCIHRIKLSRRGILDDAFVVRLDKVGQPRQVGSNGTK